MIPQPDGPCAPPNLRMVSPTVTSPPIPRVTVGTGIEFADPDAGAHREEHDWFRRHIADELQDQEAKKAEEQHASLRGLVDWWIDHIQGDDRRHTDYVIGIFGTASIPCMA